MESVFNIKLPEFIEQWAAVESIDKEAATALSIAAVKYYNKRGEDDSPVIKEQERRWYASLAAGTPNFSIYDDPLSNLWACWKVYSRKYLKEAVKQSVFSDMKNVRTAVDVGCGCGYTTAAIKELLPDADVFGTEFKEDSQQWRFAAQLGKVRRFSLVTDVQALNKKVDMIFASEYFEHIEDPIAHLLGILKYGNPEYLLIANSFNTHAAGHFIDYKFLHDIGLFESRRDGKSISRLFNQTLRNYGYEKVETGCWNGKPSYWRRRG